MSNCPETKIIGCSCVVVIFTTQRGWQLQENQVTDYCGIKLIGISSQLSEGVFSWPLKPRFSTQTQFHRIIRALLAIWASALCVCVHRCMRVWLFSLGGVSYFDLSLPLLWSLCPQTSWICACSQMCVWLADVEQPELPSNFTHGLCFDPLASLSLQPPLKPSVWCGVCVCAGP